MKPIQTERSNTTFVGADGSDVLPLPARVENFPTERGVSRMISSTWALDAEERIAIAEGANIELTVYAWTIPPVGLAIDTTPIDLGPPPNAQPKAG